MTTATAGADPTAGSRLGGGRAWIVWFLAANAFFFAFFQRAAPSVMVDPLMTTFSVGAGVMGNLAALYLYIYAVLQLPVGLMLDRWGPRILLTGGMLVAAAGTAAFAFAENIWVAYAGRLAIGAGSAVGFISALTLAAAWHTPGRFGMFSGMTMGYAMLGGFLAQGPLGHVVEQMGWRDPVAFTAVWGAALAVLIWIVVRDRPDGGRVQRTGSQSLGRSLLQAMSLRHNWVLGVYGCFLSGPFLSYGLLWGVPHIMLIYDVGRETAGFSASLMTIGFAIGGPLGGFLSDRFRRRKLPLMIAAGTSLLLWAVMLYGPPMPLFTYQIMIFLVGLFGGSMILTLALARELSPPSIGGAVTGFVNGAFVGGGALMQPLVGIVLDLAWDGTVTADGAVPYYSPAHFDTALSVLPILVGIGFLISFVMRESYCRPVDG
ncbi:MAG: MFS transporter [Minwuia sp.]|uniref:MFS transporter n=1 Tax=Minwuia sp. TaxID=2493630 RepID=UPI003A8C6EED